MGAAASPLSKVAGGARVRYGLDGLGRYVGICVAGAERVFLPAGLGGMRDLWQAATAAAGPPGTQTVLSQSTPTASFAPGKEFRGRLFRKLNAALATSDGSASTGSGNCKGGRPRLSLGCFLGSVFVLSCSRFFLPFNGLLVNSDNLSRSRVGRLLAFR